MDKEKLVAYWNKLKEQPNKLIAFGFSALAIFIILIVLIGLSCSGSHNDEANREPAGYSHDSAYNSESYDDLVYFDTVSGTDNIFMAAEEHKMYTTMGTGGYTAYIAVKKDAAQKATSEQFYEFAHTRVENSGYKWYCIRFEDSTGIIFYACNPIAAQYGVVNRSNEMVEPHGNILLTDDGTYEYHVFPEYYVSDDENLEELTTESFFKSWYIKAMPCQMIYKEEPLYLNSINSYEDKIGEKYYLYIVYTFDVSAISSDSLNELLDKDLSSSLHTVDEDDKYIDSLKTFASVLHDDKSLSFIFSLIGDKPFAETVILSQISITQDRIDDYSYAYFYKFFVRNNTPSTENIPEPLYSQIKDKIIRHEN